MDSRSRAIHKRGGEMTDIEHAKKYAEESISLAISMYNPKAEIIAETACLYGLTYKNEQIADLEKENAELKAENQKWKDEWQEQVQKATDEGYARTLQTMQLTKAKEIIKGWLGDFYNPKAFYQQRAELVEQSEQFLKDSEVEK